MKGFRTGLVCLGLALPLLAGCGSSSTPPFSLSCTTHKGPAGNIRAAVTIANNSSIPARALLYGPVLINVLQFTPVVLIPRRVTVESSSSITTYPGFLAPRISPNAALHLVLRFSPPAKGGSIAVTNGPVVQASDANLDNGDCVIK